MWKYHQNINDSRVDDAPPLKVEKNLVYRILPGCNRPLNVYSLYAVLFLMVILMPHVFRDSISFSHYYRIRWNIR